MKRLSVYTMIVGCVTLLSCDKAVEPPTTGGITLRIVMGSDGGSASAAAASQETQSSRPHLDSAFVILTGPTPKTVSVTPPTNVTIDGLSAGLYGVALEGWQNDEVVFAGRVTGVQVVAGQDNAVTDVCVIPTMLSFGALGETIQLNCPTGTSWLSSDESVATVDATTGLVTAVSNGEATITGTLASATADATAAVAQEVEAVTVTLADATPIPPGATKQFSAEATDSNGNPLEGVGFLWVSSNHNVLTVDQTGLATGIGAGTATISATARGFAGSAALTVTPIVIVPTRLAFSVQPMDAVLNKALSPAVQVEIRDADGALVTTARDAITLAIGTNPSGGVLSGTNTVNAVGGIATFSGLSIDQVGAGYTLVARSGALLMDATSDAFAISSCTGSATFNFTGANQTFTIPVCVTSVTIEAWGAEGGSGSGPALGGLGGRASGQLAVTGGSTLTVVVGSQGTNTSGGDAGVPGVFGGGGDGGTSIGGATQPGGAAGGGASDVRQGGSALADRVIVAGGGGGAGGGTSGLAINGGAGGGLIGGNGVSYALGLGFEATGGTQTAGGANGSFVFANVIEGTAGALGLGGNGDGNGFSGGGGGGGGYFGGGGGSTHFESGGGGGSSYLGGVTGGTTSSSVQSGHGQVIISW